jgi:hypothetical protein
VLACHQLVAAVDQYLEHAPFLWRQPDPARTIAEARGFHIHYHAAQTQVAALPQLTSAPHRGQSQQQFVDAEHPKPA